MDTGTRYELLEKIGAGSFATVYRARDNELKREVAVKQIHEQYLDDPGQLDRYWQEAQLLASFQHPNIMTIFDIDREKGWLIMELMQANLAERMAGRQMDLRALKATLAHGLRALKYLHERGVIHGDIKTSNLMIDSRRRVKIGDFGLARRASDDDGSLLKGTTKYMAPELVSEEFGEIGPSSDLYSLGFACYELMCGPNFETLFPGLSAFGRNKQIAWMMWHAAPDRKLPRIEKILQGVPEDLSKVIQKLCEKDQSRRYQTAQDALDDLNIDVRPDSTSTSPVPGQSNEDVIADPNAPPEDPERKKKLLIAAGALGVSLLLCLFMLFSGGEKPAPAKTKLNVGFIREVKVGDNQIVWEGANKPIPYDLAIETNPEIWFYNEERYLQLRDVRIGDRIEWEDLPEGQRGVKKFSVARPVSNAGVVSDLDVRKDQITITIEDSKNREDVLFRVPERAMLKLNGTKIKLGDLKSDDHVRFKHLAPVGGEGSRVLEELIADRPRSEFGFLHQIDTGRKVLTIRSGSGIHARIFPLTLSDDCDLKLQGPGKGDGFPIQISDLKVGDRVRFDYDDTIHKLIVSRSESSLIGAAITSVNPSRSEVVVKTPNNENYTIKVTPQSEITLNNDLVKLSYLRMSDAVDVTYDEDGSGQFQCVTIDSRRPVINDRTAILIVTQDFSDNNLSSLRHSIHSAQRIENALIDRYAFSSDRIHTLRDMTVKELENQIAQLLSQIRSEIQLIVYVNSQAYETETGKVYIAGTDFKLSDLENTGLSLDWLTQQIDRCASNDKMLLLDCSHQGAAADLQKQPSTAVMLKNIEKKMTSTYAIASCDQGQKGHDDLEAGCSYFAQYLAEGFAGEAGTPQKTRLTARDLWSYVTFRFSEKPVGNGTIQRPILITP